MNKDRTTLYLVFGYLFAVIVLMLVKHVTITPDRLFIFFLIAALVLGKGKIFLRDWLPFLILLLSYEFLRGFADSFGNHVNITNIIAWEKSIFGFIPTVILQKIFYHPGHLNWYDIGAATVYFLHFPLPLLGAFFLWIKDKNHYWKFVISLLVLSFSAFITFLLFPAAPPWLAAKEGYLPGVQKIIENILSSLGASWNLSYLYTNLNPNPVAAIPSLHAAYPWLLLLSLSTFNKKWVFILLPYSILVWLALVYLGEHYVVDLGIGVIYATASFLLVYRLREIKRLFFEHKTMV